ncbi:hypothetical protein AWC01_14030 [Mycobacterium doricum]|uniref:Uncharacterized protein n=1 Tax=Mycolicibacterium doricum TaxID=126673 RepID=A0A1X1T2W7_9MYCO|nr:hypothetical protein AWC01_14030 [Mycolicibacterium doricum]
MVAAALAEQQSFEVVVEDAVAGAASAARLLDFLNTLEEVLADDRFVPSGVDVTFVDDEAGVVGVAEHPVHLRIGHRSACRPADGWLAGQAEVGHRGSQPFDGVVAGRVKLAGFQYQWGTVGVEADGVDLSPFDYGPGVEVADWGSSRSTAVDGFVLQFDSDVFTAELVLDIVEDVGDGLHHVGVDAVAEVLSRRDEFDVQLVEEPFGDGGVDVVAEGA